MSHKEFSINPKQLAIIGLIIAGAGILMSFSGCVIGTLNKEVELRNAVVAKSTANEASLDTMWKVIKQKANITEKAASEIKDMNKVYEELVDGRSGGMLFKMVTENYPNLGQSEVAKLYTSVMVSVEAERKTFKNDQQILVDVNRERDNLIDKPISGIILSIFGDNTKFTKRNPGNTGDHTFVFVTSTNTQKMVDSGAEDNIELFGE